jgi:hypothetical protein
VLFAPASQTSASACLVGLAIRAKLELFSPCELYKFDVRIIPNGHIIQQHIETQINDKKLAGKTFENSKTWQKILKLIM